MLCSTGAPSAVQVTWSISRAANGVVDVEGFSYSVALGEDAGRYVGAGVGDWDALLQQDVQHHLALLQH